MRAPLALLFLSAMPLHAAFHIMQVEEVIGSIYDNPTAQVIQLRMRSNGQGQVQNSSLWAWDATGSNRILLLNINASVTNSTAGSRVLLSTASFTSLMLAGGATGFAPDFTLTNAIPASYLAAGRITFENDSGTTATPGTIYWSMAWGGAAYTGPTTGNTQNDVDGNYGKLDPGLPTSGIQAVKFNGAVAAPSTTNSADYSLVTTGVTVTKNNGTTYTVVPEPGSVALVSLGALGLGTLALARRRRG